MSRSLLSCLSALALGFAQLGCEASPAPPPPPTAQVETAPEQPPIDRESAADAAAAGRYDLGRDERRGGHTLERHVGRSDADLRARLKREPRISAASTYTDRATAERVVALTLERNRARVDQWVSRQGSRPNLALDYRAPRGEPIGRSLTRRGRTAVECTDAVVVLRWDDRGGFYVLTSYPEASR